MHHIKKLPGFRSGSLRNMFIAGFVYVSLIIGLIGACTDAVGITGSPAATPSPTTAATAVAAAPTATPTQEPTPPPTQEPTPVATATPTPEPTPTPAPTPTPTPEPTPTPDRTAERAEQAYIQKVVDLNKAVSGALSKTADLIEDPNPWDQNWIFQFAGQLVIIRTANQEALALDAPPRYADMHSVWLSAFALYDEATYLLAEGIDNLDVSLINQATGKINEANGKLQEATALLPGR